MNDAGKPAETGPETAQKEPTTPTVDSTVPAPQPVASGPSFQLVVDEQELANVRIQTVYVDGKPCGMGECTSKALSGEQGHVVIVADAAPNYGGGDILSSAVGSRGRTEMTLVANDDKNKDVKGDFVVGRFSPAGMVNGEQLYTIVLENAGPAPKAEDAGE